MTASKDTFLEYQKILGLDITQYLSDYVLFTQDSYPNLVSFFSGRPGVKLSSVVFDNLGQLLKTAGYINENIYAYKDRFTTAEHWVITENLEEIRIRLFTISHISKWLRSSQTEMSWNAFPEFDYIMLKYETLESIHYDRLRDFTGYNNNWVQTAVRNNLYETDYTPEGGVLLKLPAPIVGNVFLKSVVDNLSGRRLYGLDIKRKITLTDNDLLVLGYEETFQQAVSILSELKKKDIPEFPFMGVDPRFGVGSNVGSLSYPVIIRQLVSVFSSDDTIAEFRVEKIRTDNGALYIDFTARSQYDLTYNSTFKA